jgi:hypothetical protein
MLQEYLHCSWEDNDLSQPIHASVLGAFWHDGLDLQSRRATVELRRSATATRRDGEEEANLDSHAIWEKYLPVWSPRFSVVHVSITSTRPPFHIPEIFSCRATTDM